MNDPTRDKEVKVYFDVSVYNIPCDVLTLDVLDVSGKHQSDLSTSKIEKVRLDQRGQFAGSWYHAHVQRRFNAAKANEMKKQVEAGEGCRVRGEFLASRVAGNFHLSCHGTELQMLAAIFGDIRKVNVSHWVHQLGFSKQGTKPLPSIIQEKVLTGNKTGIYEYFLKLVPISYEYLSGSVDTYDFSETTYMRTVKDSMPGIYFIYDIYPLKLLYKRGHLPVSHLLTQLLGVIGGIVGTSNLLRTPFEYLFLKLTNMEGGIHLRK
eukprot:CAMPEP_0113870304 /NCGR_PEP_ID=MMETSP0780_2-20120614/2012_1 /TAXON_ID=652834 /ORGANISM="Palpitomonas bilix" /LENGTH=263 /DNA_ID=CAMNT_0000855567 /DNA_START=295 /DNA_END=1086 /DNA_ORIENTATION=- /assembly_acc=CAM_ASM_000599